MILHPRLSARRRVASPRCFLKAAPAASVFLSGPRTAVSSLSVEQLRCEYLADPSGIDVLRPRLSWILQAGDPAAIEGRVVHDDLETAGEFTCSNPLLNRIYRNIVWGVARQLPEHPHGLPSSRRPRSTCPPAARKRLRKPAGPRSARPA